MVKYYATMYIKRLKILIPTRKLSKRVDIVQNKNIIYPCKICSVNVGNISKDIMKKLRPTCEGCLPYLYKILFLIRQRIRD